METWERVGLAVVLAVVFGLIWGVGSGFVECGLFGCLVGGMLGAIIE